MLVDKTREREREKEKKKKRERESLYPSGSDYKIFPNTHRDAFPQVLPGSSNTLTHTPHTHPSQPFLPLNSLPGTSTLIFTNFQASSRLPTPPSRLSTL